MSVKCSNLKKAVCEQTNGCVWSKSGNRNRCKQDPAGEQPKNPNLSMNNLRTIFSKAAPSTKGALALVHPSLAKLAQENYPQKELLTILANIAVETCTKGMWLHVELYGGGMAMAMTFDPIEQRVKASVHSHPSSIFFYETTNVHHTETEQVMTTWPLSSGSFTKFLMEKWPQSKHFIARKNMKLQNLPVDANAKHIKMPNQRTIRSFADVLLIMFQDMQTSIGIRPFIGFRTESGYMTRPVRARTLFSASLTKNIKSMFDQIYFTMGMSMSEFQMKYNEWLPYRINPVHVIRFHGIPNDNYRNAVRQKVEDFNIYSQ